MGHKAIENTCVLIGQLTDSQRKDLENRGWVFTPIKGLKGMPPEETYMKCLMEGSLHEIMTGKIEWPKAEKVNGSISKITFGPTHRTNDTWTSLRASFQAHLGSPKAIMGTFVLMSDGQNRIDQEIREAFVASWGKMSLSSIQHARLNLANAGLLKYAGVERLTEDNSPSHAHVQSEAMVHEIQTKGMRGCLQEIAEMTIEDSRRRARTLQSIHVDD